MYISLIYYILFNIPALSSTYLVSKVAIFCPSITNFPSYSSGVYNYKISDILFYIHHDILFKILVQIKPLSNYYEVLEPII